MTSPDLAGLGLPASESRALHHLLNQALRRTGGDRPPVAAVLPWSAQHFGLDRVQCFRAATEADQQAILAAANRALLEEAYFIEKAGMGYMARMVTLADTTEERMLYSLFGADEAQHFAAIRGLLPEEPVGSEDPFLRLLAQVVASEDKLLLVFVLQGVLEGWGLTHYRTLAHDCQDPALGSLLKGFLQAESQHHGAGCVLCEAATLSPATEAAILETLAPFLQMVQVGPQRVLGAIAQQLGDLSRAQRCHVLEELDTLTHSGTRLQVLRQIIARLHPAVGDRLAQAGLFTPLPAHQCV